MADRLRVELTDGFLERLDAIEAFLAEGNVQTAFDRLLVELRSTVVFLLSIRHCRQLGFDFAGLWKGAD